MKAQGKTLVIRADASLQIGTGHVMRCLALAQEWQAQGGGVTFVCSKESEGFRERIEDLGMEFLAVQDVYPSPADLQVTVQVLNDKANPWLVLDGYHFDIAYQQGIRQAGHKLLVVDDLNHHAHYSADAILNQNIYAKNLDYSCDTNTLKLFGTDYAMLRSEFAQWREWKRETPEKANRILVTLGGADPDNATLKVVQALQGLEDEIAAYIIVGPANPHLSELESAINSSRKDIRVLPGISNVSKLMAWANVAVTAGGSTCWEMAFMGLPNAIIVVADNQQGIAEGLGEAGVSLNLGWHEDVRVSDIEKALGGLLADYGRRLEMSRRGRRLVDGLGCQRIVSALLGHETSPLEPDSASAYPLPG